MGYMLCPDGEDSEEDGRAQLVPDAWVAPLSEFVGALRLTGVEVSVAQAELVVEKVVECAADVTMWLDARSLSALLSECGGPSALVVSLDSGQASIALEHFEGLVRQTAGPSAPTPETGMAAVIRAELARKVEAGLDEDDPHDPVVAAGSADVYVGDTAGKDIGLSEYYAGSFCDVVTPRSPVSPAQVTLPFRLMAAGLLTTFAGLLFVDTGQTGESWVTDPSTLICALNKVMLVENFVFATFAFGFVILTYSADGATGPELLGCDVGGVITGLSTSMSTKYFTSFSCAPTVSTDRVIRGLATTMFQGVGVGIVYDKLELKSTELGAACVLGGTGVTPGEDTSWRLSGILLELMPMMALLIVTPLIAAGFLVQLAVGIMKRPDIRVAVQLATFFRGLLTPARLIGVIAPGRRCGGAGRAARPLRCVGMVAFITCCLLGVVSSPSMAVVLWLRCRQCRSTSCSLSVRRIPIRISCLLTRTTTASSPSHGRRSPPCAPAPRHRPCRDSATPARRKNSLSLRSQTLRSCPTSAI